MQCVFKSRRVVAGTYGIVGIMSYIVCVTLVSFAEFLLLYVVDKQYSHVF
jgi:hypothetical protein